ncbi:hypothetical protein M2350_000181 [Candidatus Fervidibacter sacchari]|uniref:Uncharacterized protein n=1 Tax=Candidatus Fervidibacter sacchari TaxID=1448929 RepID=A0ABT2EJB8_9BACT|nr:hypothetical protein [Candidatus Fervidibacter sacchari]
MTPSQGHRSVAFSGGALPANERSGTLRAKTAFAPLLSSFVLRVYRRTQRLLAPCLPLIAGRLPGFIGRVDPPPLVMRGWERRRRINYNPPVRP